MSKTEMNTHHTAKLEPEKLLETLMIARVDYIQLTGPDEDEATATLLSQSLPIVTKAWKLPQEALEEAQGIILTELENMRHEAETGEHTPCSLPKNKVLQGMDGNEILQVIWSLFETSVHTEDADEREQLLGTARFLSEYWDLQEWICK